VRGFVGNTDFDCSSTEILNDRSSAVCAILARLPQVERAPGREIVLRWR
jgi:hypothetical protein